MADLATPNLPSSDYDTTVAFYERLGFEVRYRDDGWLILVRGDLVLEFFLWRDVDPATSGFSCCLRLDDVDAFYAVCLRRDKHLPDIAALIDPDGTLLRLVQNPETDSATTSTRGGA